jgi:hypothetical protein
MAFSFLFFFVGFFIFLARSTVKKKGNVTQILIITLCGSLTSLGIGLGGGTSIMPQTHIPLGIFALIGGLTGLIIYFAEKGKFFTRAGIQYVATITLGLIVACLFWMAIFIYQKWFQPDLPMQGKGNTLFILFLLWGFLTIFGYTFPHRWFRQIKYPQNRPSSMD